MHVPGSTRIQQEILAVTYLEASVTSSTDGVGDFIGYFGGHVELERVLIHDFLDIVDKGVRMSEGQVIIGEIIDPCLGGIPVNMKIEHLVQWKLGEICFLIDQELASLFHFCPGKVDGMIKGRRIGPAQIIIKCMGSDIAEDRPSVTPASRGCTPDIIYQFMVIKGEETGNIPVPLGQRDPPAEIKFIVFPDPHHCRHQIDHRG